MIDPHVHLRDWNQKDKETIGHGLSLYKRAGFSWVFDMPNTNPPLTSEECILKRLEEGEGIGKAYGIRYSVYAGLTSDEDQIEAMVKLQNKLFPRIIGLKLFLSNSTGNMGITTIDDQRRVIRILSECGYKGVLVVHAEKESLNDSSRFDINDFSTHSLARPGGSEIESIRDIITLVDEVGFGGHLHIAHISTKGAVELVKSAKDKGLSISMGATPHHSLYNVADAKERSRYLKMNPPLRDESDRAYIFSSLLDGVIDDVESDHAPHTLSDKEKGASGIPGLSGMLLLLHVLRKNGASEERLKDLYGRNIARIFSLSECDIHLPDEDEVKRVFESLKGEYPFESFVWRA